VKAIAGFFLVVLLLGAIFPINLVSSIVPNGSDQALEQDAPFDFTFSSRDTGPVARAAWIGGTITIDVDGSISPSDAPLERSGNVYTVIGDIDVGYNAGIYIYRDNAILDGAFWTLHGGWGYSEEMFFTGVNVEASGVTVKNLRIDGFDGSICIYYQSDIVVSSNTILNSSGQGQRIAVFGSNCSVFRNHLEGSGGGIWLGGGSNNNSVYENTVISGSWIGTYGNSGNSIYHNNFLSDIEGVWLLSAVNVWDLDYPSGGNYWSDYNGTDMYRGQYQNETGSDGIGDTPYVLDVNNVDRYPLMNPYSSFTPLSVTISPSSVTLGMGQSKLFEATVAGGMLAYTYKWYLNGAKVPDAVFSNWAFTATSGGSFTVYAEVTDGLSAKATSNIATVTVTARAIVFAQTGVGSDFGGALLTIDGINYTVQGLPVSFWWDIGSSHSFSFTSPLVVGGKQYLWSSTSGLSTLQGGSLIVAESGSIIGNYIVQKQITFAQTGVGSDFVGTVLIIDGVNYTVQSLPVSFWWNNGSSHSFSFASPLVVGGKQYLWNSTSGLSTLQNGTLTVTETGSIVGNYIVRNQITFDQIGAGSDFTGTIITVDGVNYSKAQLPLSFSWSVGSNHTFSFQSPLLVNLNAKRYFWTGTTGLSTLQNGSITVTTFGSIIGHYKTQYYLTVTSTYDSPVPLSGWVDSGTTVISSVVSPASGPNGTRYVCTGWDGTGNVPTHGTGSNTTFTMSQPSNITWNWKTQHLLTVFTSPEGLSPQPSRIPSGEYRSANSWWYDSSTNVTLSAQTVTGYNLAYWSINGASQGLGVNPVYIVMNAPQSAIANYRVYVPPSAIEVKAFYTLDSFFLGNMYDLVPMNQYFVKGNDISRVEFSIYLNGTEQTYISTTPDEDGWFNSSFIDMAQVTSSLTVTAYSLTEDAVSRTLATNVYDTPYWLQSLIEMAQEKGYLNVTIDPAQPLTRFDNVWSIGFYYNWPETPMDAVYDIPVPILGGKYGITCGFSFNMGLQSNGEAVVGGGGGIQFYISDAEAKIGIYVTGAIAIENGTIRLTNLKIQISGSVEVPFKHNYSWNGIGVEIGIYVGGSVSCTLYLQEASSGNGTFGFGLDWVEVEADVALWLGAYAQVGCWVGEVRIEGEGKVTFTFHMPPPYFTYPDDLNLEASVTLTVRSWWFCWTCDLFTYSSHSPVQWTLNSSETGWIPREWANGNYSLYKWIGSASEGTYLESVYPYANPSVDTSSGRTIMLWTQDDLSKPFIKGYEIYYATYDKITGNWSVPVPVTDDMIPQGDAVVKFDSNGNAVTVWTQLNDSSLNETLDPFSLLTDVQLAYAVWNPATNTWSEPRQITNEEKFHYSPTLISDKYTGNLMLVWMADDDGNLTTSNDESIYSSVWNGTAWSIPTLVTTPGLLASSVTGAYDQGKAALVWSQNIGGNATNLNDIEIFSSEFDGTSWTPSTRLTNNSFVDINPSVTYWNNYPVYAWVQKVQNQSDVLMILDPYGDNVSKQFLERTTISSPMLKVDSQNRLLVFWTNSDLPYSSTLNSDGTITIAEMANGENTSKNIYCGLYKYTAGMADSNYDGIVDIYDAIRLANAFNSAPGSHNWNIDADINGDGIVDIYDAIILAGSFGKTFPNRLGCRQITPHRLIAMSEPVDGYSVPLIGYSTTTPPSVYLALFVMLPAVFTKVKRIGRKKMK